LKATASLEQIMSMTFVDLVLEDGELVRIECPTEHSDELHDTLQQAIKRRDFWSPSLFDGCNAEYLGLRLDRVNMARVVGML
jgi:hypothetical protein